MSISAASLHHMCACIATGAVASTFCIKQRGRGQVHKQWRKRAASTEMLPGYSPEGLQKRSIRSKKWTLRDKNCTHLLTLRCELLENVQLQSLGVKCSDEQYVLSLLPGGITCFSCLNHVCNFCSLTVFKGDFFFFFFKLAKSVPDRQVLEIQCQSGTTYVWST